MRARRLRDNLDRALGCLSGSDSEKLAMSTMGPLCPEQLTQEETLDEVCVGPKAAVAYRLLNWKERPPCKRHLLRAGRR
jgi:hypothetical protein